MIGVRTDILKIPIIAETFNYIDQAGNKYVNESGDRYSFQ